MTQLTRRRPRKWLGRCRRAERPHRESAALRRFRACRWRGVGVRPLKVAEHEPAFFDRLAVVVRRPPLEPADKHFGGARSTGQPRRTARRTGPGWRRFRTPRASARSRSREALRSHPRARHSRRPRRTTHSGWLVSVATWNPRFSSFINAVDLPVPDIPVTRTLRTAAG
jgi:hypothetical protein